MDNKETKVLGANHFLNKVLGDASNRVKRVDRIDYPVYCLPVEVKERSSEPYQEIEKNIEKIIYLTEVNNRVSLIKTMGLEAFKNVGNITIDYLLSINHLEEKSGMLSITELGIESIKSNEKIKIEKSARLMYFDALCMKPLPKNLYRRDESMFISPVDGEEFWRLNVIDIWEDLPSGIVKDILELNGEERLKYNIPQEALDITIDNDVLKYTREQIMSKGVIMFFPLFVVVYDNIYRFTKDNLKIHNGISGKEEEFFSSLIHQNFSKIQPILSPMTENFTALVDGETFIWGEKLSETTAIKRNHCKIDNDENILYYVDEQDVKLWISNDNYRALKDAVYKNIVPLSDRNHHGRLVKLMVNETAQKLLNDYMVERLRKKLEGNDRSKAYIEREINKLLKKLN